MNIFVKSAIVIAALMSSSSALAQSWQGTWSTDYGQVKLIENGNHVYGDYGNWGTIEGRLSPDKGTFRGIYKRNDDGSSGYFEWKQTRANNFTGRWTDIKTNVPAWNRVGTEWRGTRNNSATPKLSVLRNVKSLNAFLAGAPIKYRNWAFDRSSNLANSGSTPPPIAATQGQAVGEDTGLKGSWRVNISGSEYGPFKDREQAFFFSAPDSNGIVTGFSPSRPVIFVGQKVSGSGGMRGVWMETKASGNYQATGRWGLMEVKVGGEPSRYLEAYFSVGYRPPNITWTKNLRGKPGMRGSGQKITSDISGLPSSGVAQNSWSSLTRKTSPYPAIHGIWPTAKINSAIQSWIKGEQTSSNFGGSQTVDPCAAECMGTERSNIFAQYTHADVDQLIEKNTEIAGKAELWITIKSANGSERSVDVKRPIFDQPRNKPVKDWRPWMVQPPAEPGPFPCRKNTRYSDFGRANFDIPDLLWSDPLSDVIINGDFALYEVDLIKAGDDKFDIWRNVSVSAKKTWQKSYDHAQNSISKNELANSAYDPSLVCWVSTYDQRTSGNTTVSGTKDITSHILFMIR